VDKNEFYTIEKSSFAEIREKASKFLAFAYPVESEFEGNQHAENLWKMHPKATHVCYAFKVGVDDKIFRINDDGEPSGTAGKPIFNQLLSKNLTDIGVYVVRYYGGTKLGTTGLIAAYKEATKLALDEAIIIKKSLNQCFDLFFSYDHMGKVLNDLKYLNIHIVNKEFEVEAKVSIAINLSESDEVIRKIKAKLLDFSIDRISDETKVDFCKFVKQGIIKV
jgi:uncharacterized YigZ family protein